MREGSKAVVRMRRVRARSAMPQSTEQLRHKYRLLAVHWGMMCQRYPNKHWARNYDPAHFRNHVDWLLGDSVAQLKAVTATGQESVSPAWPVVLRYELELRKEVMKLLNMASVTLAEALAAARRNDELRTCFLITPLALGGGQRQQQEARRDEKPTDRTKTKQPVPQPQPKASGKRGRRNNTARDNKRQKVAHSSQGGTTRYGRARKEHPNLLHQRHNGRTICFAYQNPSGCSSGEACPHQHICAHCFGPHSFDKCGSFPEARSAYLKNRLDTVKRRFSQSAITSHPFRKKQHVGRAVSDTTARLSSKVESPCSSVRKVPVELLRVGAVQGGVGLPTPPTVSCSVSRIQQVPGPCKESGVGLPTPQTMLCPESQIQQSTGPCMTSGVGIPTPLEDSAKHASSPVGSKFLAMSQPSQNSVSSKNPVFTAFSSNFTENSKNCSPDELTVLELRGPGLTPHKKSTGFLAALSRPTSESPRWTGRTLNVLSVFSGQEHAAKLQEGASLLQGSPLVQVKEVDTTALGLNLVKQWPVQAKEILFDIQQQKFDLVLISLPSKGMSRTMFANKLGPSPLRSKGYPYGYPWLSQHTKRVNDAVTIEAAFMLALALATLVQNHTALALFAAEERGKAFYGEPCSWWQTEEVRLMSELGAARGALYSCEVVQKWTKQVRDKPGSLGFMTNFCLQGTEFHEGWPQLSEASSSYVGPLPDRCKCGGKHTSLVTARPQSAAVDSSICAQVLQSLPRLPEERGSLNMCKLRVKSAGRFSPLSDPDSPGIFLFRQQPWLQARWQAWQESGGLCSHKSDQFVVSFPEREGEKKGGGRMEEGDRVASGSVLAIHDTVIRRNQETEGLARVHGAGLERASAELEFDEDARGIGRTLTAKPGRENVKFRRVGVSPKIRMVPKFGRTRHLEKSESHRQWQPEKSESHRQCQPEKSESHRQCQLELSRAELLRSKPTRGCISEVKRLQRLHLYIGRGASHLKCARSLWANPFTVKTHGREGAIRRFRSMLQDSQNLQQQLHQLTGKVLLCHCSLSEPCHGDVLIQAWEDKFLSGAFLDEDEEAAQAEELFRAAALRQPVEEPESQSEEEAGQEPRGAGWRGEGDPLMVGSSPVKRELHDGAGLCSPGRWPIERRNLPESPLLCNFRRLLKGFVVKLLDTTVFERLACGKVKDCPMGEELNVLREQVYQLFETAGEEPRRKITDLASPLEFRLLGAFLSQAKDPERDLPDFADGVRVGVGCKMPRVPAVYARKRKWKLKEQEDPDGYQWYEPARGADNKNYSSAAELDDAVEDQLEQSVLKGQAFRLTEEEARERYGSKLVIASLGAQVKSGAKDTGDLKVRLLFDGTHGVPVNKNIRVRDQDRAPAAPDLKRVLRQLANQEGPKFGFKVDVSDAHRLIPIKPCDWHLLACRSEKGKDVYINTTGTFGVANTWWRLFGVASAAVLSEHITSSGRN